MADHPTMIQEHKTPLAAALAKSGLSANKLALMVGTSRQNISRWVNGDIPIPLTWAKRIAPVLRTSTNWLVLGDADDPPAHLQEDAIAVVEGKRLRTVQAAANAIPELDALLGAGAGGLPLGIDARFDDGTYSAEVVRAEWIFPERFVTDELHAKFSDIEIIGIRGDSMIDNNGKGFRDGDRVMVHRRDKAVRQGGVFAVRDDSEIIVKQVEIIRGSDPPRILCTSLNTNYQPFELVLDGSAALIGRVILHIARV